MPYQGSAQSIGFRNRNVIDPSKRMRAEAAQIKEQGRERIQGMKEQASQRTQETQRVSDIQTSNARYELKALSKFSNSINDLLQNEVLDLEKERIKGEIEEGKRLYAEQGPEYQQQLQEVNEAGNRSQELDTQLNDLADKAPTTEAADRVRNLSRWRQHGWNLAAMRQSGEKFGNHLLAELDTNTTIIVDPETGQKFQLNAYDGDSQYEAAISYIQSEFIKNNNPAGLSAKVVNTVLLPEIFKATSIHQRDYYDGQRVEKATELLDDAQRDLHESLNGTAGFPTASVSIPAFLKKAASAYRKLGVQGSPDVAARKDLLDQINLRLKEKPNDVEAAILSIDDAKIIGHPAGAKSLFELYPDEFNATNMRAIALEGRAKAYDDRQKSTRMEAELDAETLRQSINNGLSDVQLRQALQTYQKKHGAVHPDLVQNLRTYEPSFLGVEQSEAKVSQLLDTYGDITEEEAANLDTSVYQKYKQQNKIVEKRFGDGQKDAIRDAEKKIDGEIRKAVQATDTNATLGYDAQQAATRAKQQMFKRAKQLYDEANGTLSQEEAFIQASSEIAAKIKLEAQGIDASTGKPVSDPTSLTYYSASGAGFPNFYVKPASETEQMVANKVVIDNYKIKAFQYENPAIQANLNLNPSRLELTADGKPQHIFFSLAKLDGKHTAFEILNAQRAKQGKQPIPLPENAATVDNILKQYPDLRPLFIADQSPNRVSRGIEQIGGISVPMLMRSLGYQESGGNYKAYNSDSYGPSNPALGKYQILWKNVLAWSKQAGMPHPGTMDDFRNSPNYQEKLANWKFSDYVKQASTKTNDPDIAIRMAASAWYSGDMSLYNNTRPQYANGKEYPSIQKYTMKVLQRYKEGL